MVVKVPGMAPRIEELSGRDDQIFTKMRKLVTVSGWKPEHTTLQRSPFNTRLTLWCDEDGRARMLRPNFFQGSVYIRGTAIFSRFTDANGFVDMLDSDIAEVIRFFSSFGPLAKREVERCFTCHEPFALGEGTDNHKCGSKNA